MTAADRILVAGALERVRATARRWVPIACIATAALTAAYCHGVTTGEVRIRTAMTDSLRHVLADSSKQIEARLAARAPTIVTAIARVDTVRVAYHAAAAHVAVVSDTVLRVDSVLVNVPMPVVQVIQRCESLVVADSIALHVVAAQLTDMTADRDAWRSRAQLDEANTPHPSRFGFKAGLLTGAGVALLVLHFL